MSPSGVPGTDADVVAAGVVAWRAGNRATGFEVAVVHRPRYDDWSLPKGKLAPGEMIAEAAVRETFEETGHQVRLGARLGETRYQVPEGVKVVHYWAAEALSGRFAPNDEVDEMRWLASDAAAELISYDWDRAVLARFAAMPTVTPSILLVRHAKAGSRRSWLGIDELRPLSNAGHRQATALCRLLVLFGPDRVYAAAPLRCVQTVEPLATALGEAVTVEPLVGEDRYWDDPDAGLRRLLEVAERPVTSVVCSQGGVVPAVVHHFAAAAGLAGVVDGPDGDPPARKASTWVLGLQGERLNFADYYPIPGGV